MALLLAALLVVRVGVRSEAVPPGARGDIAFASNRTGNFDIYAMTPGSGTVTALIQTSANERAPAWNPAGTRLAFVRDTPTGSCPSPCWQLYVWNSITDVTAKLSAFGAQTQLFDTVWSNDGTMIAFTKMDTVVPLQVYVVPADGSSSPRRVTGTSVAESSPDWSPDDSALVMSHGGHLFTISSTASSGTPTALTLSGDAPAYVRDASWGPDGRIAFVGGPSSFSMFALYSANADGTGTTLLWNNGSGTLNSPAWAPDASRISFALVPSGTDYDIGILDLCTATVNYPAPDPATDADPNWQPSQPAPASIPPTCDSPSPSPTVSGSPSATSSASTTGSATSTTTSTTSTSATTTSTTSTSATTTSTSTTTTSSSATPTPSPTSVSSSVTTSPSPTPPSGTPVSITESGFSPSSAHVPRGGTVVWTNAGAGPHGAADASSMALWTTGLLPTGWPGWFAFHAAGTYRYADPSATDHVGEVLIRVGASPHRGATSTRFTIAWADVPAESGFGYDVEVRTPAGSWRTWKSAVVVEGGSFRPHAGRGTYRFRARLASASGHAAWSPVTKISVR